MKMRNEAKADKGSRPPSQTYVAALLSRINLLELQLRQARSLIDGGDGQPSPGGVRSRSDWISNTPSSFEEDDGVRTDLVETSEMGGINLHHNNNICVSPEPFIECGDATFGS